MTVASQPFDGARRAVRSLLERFAGTPAELDAFLIDYFQDIRRQCSTGMERTLTLNLLLDRVDPCRILRSLLDAFPGHAELAQVHSLLSTLTAPSQPAGVPTAAINPFHAGGAVPSALFVGRDKSLALLRSRLGGDALQSTSILGERRIGKSSLLQYLRNHMNLQPANKHSVVLYIDLMQANCHRLPSLIDTIWRELNINVGRPPWRQHGSLEDLGWGLQELHEAGHRLILLFDEIEQLTRRGHEFDPLLEALRSAGNSGQIGMVTASATPLSTLCKNGKLTSPFYNIFVQEPLGLLGAGEWQALVRGQIRVSDADLADIEQLAGGHPHFTQLCASRLWDARNLPPGDAELTWQDLARLDLEPLWEGQWQHLSDPERGALYRVAGLQRGESDRRLLLELTRKGLLRNGKLFCTGYGEWLHGKRP